jgi:trimeric autotransporter adhesin
MKMFRCRSLRLLCGALVLSFAFGCTGGNASFVPNGTSTPPVSIEVTPTSPSIALATTRQFTATGIYSDNSRLDITASVTWSSSSTVVATVSNTPGSNGLATANAAGSTTITATSGGVSGSTTLTVTSATLQSIQVAPTNPSIALATTRQFTATGIYSDNSSQDITASVTWSSSNIAIASISNVAGSNGLATAIAAGSTTITATSGVITGSTTLTVTSATLASIQVSPTNPRIALATTRQFTATGIYSDNTIQDITASVSWSSSSTTVATISNTAGSNGLATAIAAGSTAITATSGGVSGSTTLTVTSATLVSVQVAPINPSIASGTIRQFVATGIYSDNTIQDMTASVTWSSSSPAVATVSNTAGTNGLATAIAGGSTTITATSGVISGSTTLTVTSATLASIQVSPTNPRIALSTIRQFTATGIYSDNTSQDITASVTWNSSSPAIATISNTAGSNGLATAVAAGSTAITATSGGVFGSTTLTVTSATLQSIQVSPANPSIARGTTRQFTATGIYSDNTIQDISASVTWSSSSPAVATINNMAGSNGLATAIAAGSTAITAASGVISGSTTLTVTSATLQSIQVAPANPSITLGTTRQFTATGIYSDNTIQDITTIVVWGSTSPSVAAASNALGSNGLATAVAAGSTTITATSGTISGSTTLTVTSATLVSIQVAPTNPNIALGTTRQFTATGIYSDNTNQDITATVIWSSSKIAVASISNAPGSQGLATSAGAGLTAITATLAGISGSTALTVTAATLVSVQVAPTNPNIALATTRLFTATGIYSDNSHQDITAFVTWSSSAAIVASISNAQGSNGLATAIAAGLTTITATSGSVSGSTTLTVTSATLVSIQVGPTNPNIALGTTRQFTATGIYSDNSNKDITESVTWSSSNTAVATISNAPGYSGIATSASAGLTAITATLAGISGSTALTVTSTTLVSVQVAPTNPSIALGTTAQFTATGIYSDNTSQDLTTTVTWNSSNPTVAAISNAPGTSGLAAAAAIGSATITATAGIISGSTTVAVTGAVLQTIDVTPALPGIALGTSQQFVATGTYFDNSTNTYTTEDLTASVIWSSSSTTVATVSIAPGSSGLANSVGAGLTTITATLGGVSGSTDLTVTSATLVSIEVTPTDPSIACAVPQQFSASGTYSDGSVEDLTPLVTWNSSNTGVATISNAAGSNGMAIPVAAGTTNITAWFGSISGTSTLTVTTATLVSIDIVPTSSQVALGTAQQFTATGNFNDGTTQDMTASVVWTSSNSSVATISNVSPSNGLATSVSAGSTTITAAMGSVTKTATLNVKAITLTSITITPNITTIFLGAPVQFTAIGTFSDASTQDLTSQVTWRSSNKTVATVSNTSGSKGLVTPIKAGSAAISATLAGSSISGSITLTVSSSTLTSIIVTPDPASIKVGKKQQFTATGNYPGGITQDLTQSSSLTWSSSNTAVAKIVNVPKKNKGQATGVSVGTVTITARMKTTGTSGTASLTVTP